MKTTVEWLYQHLFPKQLDGFSEEEWSKIDVAFEQAKEMEKEQKIEFACQVYDKYNFGTQEISFREECEQFKQQEQ